MSRLRQAAGALIVAIALSAPAVGASTFPPRAIDNPPVAAAAQAVEDLVGGLAQGVADVQVTGRERVGTPKQADLSKAEAIGAARTSTRLNDWLADHAISKVKATFDAKKGLWTVSYVARRANGTEVTQSEVFVRDETGEVSEVRTGPQVAWMMARGYRGAFGRGINRPAVWLTLSVLFLVAMIDWRRPLSMRTLDLTALLSLGISLIWFNEGEIFTSVPLQYPPLVYLALRLGWIAVQRSRSAGGPPPDGADGVSEPRRPRVGGGLPTWTLVTLLVVTLGLRFGLNAFDSNVIDVGYAGVIGADRIVDGQTPYGTFPKDCGRCDTYGPLNYLTYVPFELAMPWKGKWDDLGAAHGAAVLFDVLAVLGMMALGWILSGARLAVALALGWSAFPFTAYSLESNSNDSLVAAMLIWGLVAARRPLGRGFLLGLALATKFAPAVLLPLWSRSPFPRARSQGRLAFLAGLCLAALSTGWVLFLDGFDGVRAFWSRTLGYQFGRDSPFSIWGQYPALRPVQIALLGLVAVAAIAVLRFPKRMDLVQFAAISGALMIGMQLTLTHWFYLYVPWFIPFALLVIVPHWPRPAVAPRIDPVRVSVAASPTEAWSPA